MQGKHAEAACDTPARVARSTSPRLRTTTTHAHTTPSQHPPQRPHHTDTCSKSAPKHLRSGAREAERRRMERVSCSTGCCMRHPALPRTHTCGSLEALGGDGCGACSAQLCRARNRRPPACPAPKSALCMCVCGYAGVVGGRGGVHVCVYECMHVCMDGYRVSAPPDKLPAGAAVFVWVRQECSSLLLTQDSEREGKKRDRDIRPKALHFREVLGDIHGRVALDQQDAACRHLRYAARAPLGRSARLFDHAHQCQRHQDALPHRKTLIHTHSLKEGH